MSSFNSHESSPTDPSRSPSPSWPEPSYTEDKWGFATLTYEGRTVRSMDPVRYCSCEKETPLFKWQKKSDCGYIFYMYYFDGGYPYFVKNKETVLKLWADYKKVRKEKKQKKEQEEAEKKRVEEEEKQRKEKEEADKKRIFPIKGSIAPTNPWKK